MSKLEYYLEEIAEGGSAIVAGCHDQLTWLEYSYSRVRVKYV